MNNSKTLVKMNNKVVGYYEKSTTYVKLWDKEGRLIHNNDDIDDAFISKFFINQSKNK